MCKKFIVFIAVVPLLGTVSSASTAGTVIDHQKISETEGNFTGILDDDDCLGNSVANLGDLNDDGVTDLAVGAYGDDDGGRDRGAVWVLFLNADGTVKGHQKISDTQGNFTGDLDDGDSFGRSVTSLGDLNGDGVIDLAVGAGNDGDGGNNRGAVWVLFLNNDGTVKDHQKISDTQGNFTGPLHDGDEFGISMASLGDLNDDDVSDLVTGAVGDNDGGTRRGAVWVLFLNSDGTVKGHQKISDTEGNFTGILDDRDSFGSNVANLGDLNGDGVTDIAVGAGGDDDGGNNQGGVWVVFLNNDGTVKDHQKISATQGNFTGDLDSGDCFNASACLGDLNGDGVTDLAVGALFDDDGGTDRGAVWVLFLNNDGTVKGHQKISATQGNFTGDLDDGDFFGAPASLGDLNGDGVTDLAVSAPGDGDGGFRNGAVWVLFLCGVPEPPITAIIDVDPDTLNKKSHGQWITAYITLPDGYNVADIDTSSIAITALVGESCPSEYSQAADPNFTPQIGDRDEDGIPDLTVKFDRQLLIPNLCLDDVAITVEGKLTNERHFTGTDTIRVISRGK